VTHSTAGTGPRRPAEPTPAARRGGGLLLALHTRRCSFVHRARWAPRSGHAWGVAPVTELGGHSVRLGAPSQGLTLMPGVTTAVASDSDGSPSEARVSDSLRKPAPILPERKSRAPMVTCGVDAQGRTVRRRARCVAPPFSPVPAHHHRRPTPHVPLRPTGRLPRVRTGLGFRHPAGPRLARCIIACRPCSRGCPGAVLQHGRGWGVYRSDRDSPPHASGAVELATHARP
jgi:hypothetical protein